MIKVESLQGKVDWGIFGALVILAPFFLFPSVEMTWVFIFVPLMWAMRWLVEKRFFERTILDWGILVLLGQVFVTCNIVPDIGFSLAKISGVVFGIALFYAVVNLVGTEGLIKKAVVLYMAGGVVFAGLAFLGMRSFEGWKAYEEKQLEFLMDLRRLLPRIDFNFSGAEIGFNPNPVGGSLVLLLPLFIVFLYLYKKRYGGGGVKNKLIFYLLVFGLIFELGVLLFTVSRGSWVALLSSSFILLYPIVKKKKIFVIIAVCVLLACVVFYIILIGPEDIKLSGEEIGGKIVNRNELWAVGINMIVKHPFTGAGLNRLRKDSEIGDTRAHAHNHLIHTAAELGVPGLVAYMAILIGAGYMCVKVWKKAQDDWMRMAVFGLGWGQVAHLIFGIGDSVPLGSRPGILFWVSVGMIAAIYNIYKKA